MRFAPLVFWIGVIFFMSSPQAASAETSRFIKPIIEFFFPNASPDAFLTVHLLIRKLAHLTEYAILAFFALRAFIQPEQFGRTCIAAILLVAAVAALDEFNQSFEASRTGAVSDVLLDICGGALMIGAVALFGRRGRVRAG